MDNFNLIVNYIYSSTSKNTANYLLLLSTFPVVGAGWCEKGRPGDFGSLKQYKVLLVHEWDVITKTFQFQKIYIYSRGRWSPYYFQLYIWKMWFRDDSELNDDDDSCSDNSDSDTCSQGSVHSDDDNENDNELNIIAIKQDVHSLPAKTMSKPRVS